METSTRADPSPALPPSGAPLASALALGALALAAWLLVVATRGRSAMARLEGVDALWVMTGWFNTATDVLLLGLATLGCAVLVLASRVRSLAAEVAALRRAPKGP